MNREAAIQKINQLAARRVPFLFIADFKCEHNHILPLDEIDPGQILYDINDSKNFEYKYQEKQDISIQAMPVIYEKYQQVFNKVQQEIASGNSYLLNLTFPTSIKCSADLKTIFYQSQAKYKLWFKDEFVVFSPEIFIKLEDGKISSYPMKGTIPTHIPDAKNILLSSQKELAEHVTIVDLIRNDMSIHAQNVEVERFRYVDEVKTNKNHLLQASSMISGQLKNNNLEHLGEVIYSLLPAGSISGAPKKKTLEIIEQVENYNRGYYTGVVGIFDGNNFDSGVMIRFIENMGDHMVYKSGGGIHIMSNAKEEYLEMIDKIYVPVH